ncbi:hypothetical protein B0H14DRAFT_3148715 [Mycena olivaceomarginata]|nr:hypothetical protein B0H14DRAFT_3148715 [Mycena olivaceomarginata]
MFPAPFLFLSLLADAFVEAELNSPAEGGNDAVMNLPGTPNVGSVVDGPHLPNVRVPRLTRGRAIGYSALGTFFRWGVQSFGPWRDARILCAEEDSVKLIQLQHGQKPEIEASGWLYIAEDMEAFPVARSRKAVESSGLIYTRKRRRRLAAHRHTDKIDIGSFFCSAHRVQNPSTFNLKTTRRDLKSSKETNSLLGFLGPGSTSPPRCPAPPPHCARHRAHPRGRPRRHASSLIAHIGPRALDIVVYSPVHVLRVPHVAAHLLHNVYGAAHVLGAVHVAVHAPSSRTSLRAPSTLCAARRTPSAPSASPRMSLYRARRRARPPLFIHPEHVLRAPDVAAYLPRGMHGAEHVPHIVHKGVHDSRFAHAPRHVVVHLPGVVVHGSGFVLVAAMSLASAALPRMSHMAHVAVYALDLATRALHCASALHPAAAAPSCTNINSYKIHQENPDSAIEDI